MAEKGEPGLDDQPSGSSQRQGVANHPLSDHRDAAEVDASPGGAGPPPSPALRPAVDPKAGELSGMASRASSSSPRESSGGAPSAPSPDSSAAPAPAAWRRQDTANLGAVDEARRKPRLTPSTSTPDDARFYSYVVAAGSREARMAARAEAEAMKTGEVGVDRVVEFEADAGRVAIPQSHSNKGFDVISESPDGLDRRVIEVKATADAWPQRGIPISSSQMEKNRELGRAFWLYVVEYAASPDRARVIPIQDPGSAVDYFVFDSGWRNLASHDEALGGTDR